MFYFYTPQKHQRNVGVPMFSGGMEVEHWLKMVKFTQLFLQPSLVFDANDIQEFRLTEDRMDR